jgi:hypothetical protein
MSEANETIFNNWKAFIYTESERIVEASLQDKKYDSLHSKEWANTICELVLSSLPRLSPSFPLPTTTSST